MVEKSVPPCFFVYRFAAFVVTWKCLINGWLSKADITHRLIYQFFDFDLLLPDFEELPFDLSVLEWDGRDVDEEPAADGPSKSFESSVTIFSKSSIFFSLDSNNVVISSSLSFHLWRFFLHWWIFRTRTTSFFCASDKSLHFNEVFDLELLLFDDDISTRVTRSEYRWCKCIFQMMKLCKERAGNDYSIVIVIVFNQLGKSRQWDQF